MNIDKRTIIFSKVKKFASQKKKELRFNLNPHLDREECLKEDLKLLQIINFDPPKPLESEIICESFLPNVPQEILVLSEAELWQFVFSADWAGFSSLRIGEGKLLDTLLFYLYGLVQQGTLNTFKQAKFENLRRQVTAPPKSQQKDKSPETTAVKIKFTYFGVDPNTDCSNVKLLSSIPKRKESPRKRQSSAHFPTCSEASLESSSECGDSCRSLKLEKEGSQSPRILSQGDVSVKSEALTTVSKGDLQSLSDSDSTDSDTTKPFVVSSTQHGSISSEEVFDPKNNASPGGEKVDHCSSENIEDQEYSLKNQSSATKDVSGELLTELSADHLDIVSTASEEGRSNTSISVPRKTNSDPIPDAQETECLSTAVSLQTNIGTTASNVNKKADALIKPSFQIARSSQVPELIHDTVVFETDYDNAQKRAHFSSENESQKSNSAAMKKPLRPLLTDTDEHLILPDDKPSGIFETTNLQLWYAYNLNSEGIKDSPEEVNSPQQECTVNYHSEEPSQNAHFSTDATRPQNLKQFMRSNISCQKPAKKLHRKGVKDTSLYLKIVENQAKMQRQVHSQDGTSQGDSSSDNRSLASDKQYPKKLAPIRPKKRISTVQQKPMREEPFKDLISNYSVKIMKKKKKYNTIKSGIPTVEDKDKIVEMMENFLEEKYLPRFGKPKEKPYQPIKLAPLANAPKPSVSSLLKQIHHHNGTTIDRDEYFPERIPEDFAQMLTKACQDFIVRKEQVTQAHSWQTLTTITINRRLKPKNII